MATHLRFAPGSPATVLTFLAMSLVVGVTLGWLIETPALLLRDRWLPSKAGAMGDDAAKHGDS